MLGMYFSLGRYFHCEHISSITVLLYPTLVKEWIWIDIINSVTLFLISRLTMFMKNFLANISQFTEYNVHEHTVDEYFTSWIVHGSTRFIESMSISEPVKFLSRWTFILAKLKPLSKLKFPLEFTSWQERALQILIDPSKFTSNNSHTK